MNGDDLNNEEIFRIAAEHFSERDIDREQFSEIWRLLDRRPMTAADVVERTESSRGDVVAFLDWCRDQDLVETARNDEGERVYARYRYDLERLEASAGEARETLRGAGKGLAVAFVVLLVGGGLVGMLLDSAGSSGLADGVGVCFGCSFISAGLLAVVTYTGSGLFGGVESLVEWWRDD